MTINISAFSHSFPHPLLPSRLFFLNSSLPHPLSLLFLSCSLPNPILLYQPLFIIFPSCLPLAILFPSRFPSSYCPLHVPFLSVSTPIVFLSSSDPPLVLISCTYCPLPIRFPLTFLFPSSSHPFSVTFPSLPIPLL
jgi:hypothetical protein